MNTTDKFGSYGYFEELEECLINAISNKSIFQWKYPEDFSSLYTSMVSLADKENNVRVLAALGRVEATLKKPLFNSDVVLSLLSTEPDITALKAGDDRYYAALFVKRISPEWLYHWAIVNVWGESSAEKVRVVFLEILLDSSVGLEHILADLAGVAAGYVKANGMNEAQTTSRVIRIVKAIRAACLNKSIECELTVGKSLDSLIAAPFSYFTGMQVKADAREKVVPEVVGLMLDLIGQRFALAIESGHYAALKRMRMWCSDSVWAKLIKNDPSFVKLSNTIAEALLILARQNVADGELLMRFKDSLDSDSQFRVQCQKMANLGYLDSAVAAWLMAGGAVQKTKKTISSESVVAVKGESGDLGDLLLGMQEGRLAIEVAEDALDDLELFDPSLVPVVKDIVNHWMIVSDIAKKVAGKRLIRLVGELAESIEIDRTLFEVVSESGVNQRFGIVVRSAVVISESNRTQVIKKGVVRIIEGI
jgi:hypothetical protein